MPSVRNSTMFQMLIPQADDRCDGELLKQFVDHRDESAFGEIVRRHGPMVYGACKRILNNGSDADDAFQATFFVLARRAGHIRSSNAIGAWLHSVAVKVARKSLQQVMKRRKRQMAAAKPEAVHPATPVADWWAVIDEELDKLPDNLRQVILACDIDGQSRSRAARELGWPEGTVAKRLAKARQELAKRLTRRGVTLGVAALSASLTAEIKAAVPSRLLAETISQAPAFALGSKVGSLAARVLAEGVMRSMKSHVLTFWLLAGLIVTTLAGGGIMLAGAPAKPPETKTSKLFANVLPADVKKESSVWKEKAQIEMPGWLPVSVAFSSDGKTMVAAGGTGGKVIAYHTATRREKWSADVGGDFAAVVFSADGTSVLATFRDGVRFIDAETGKFGDAIEESGALRDWRMMAVGVFPDRPVEGGMQKLISHKIILGTPLGYVIKTWIDSGPPSTIKTSTVGADNNVADPNAIPLAVDPAGGSAIITGPIDRDTGKNVLWAYVAGNNDKARPGNRILEGHQARVVSAAWSRNGKTAITGDSEGRVIIWDAKTMKETSRVELRQRIAAVAVNSDGTQVAAAAVGKQADFYVWETAKPANNMKPIQSDAYDYRGSVFACLAFSPNDRQLVGCAINRAWLSRAGELVGKLHIWESTNANPEEKPPDAQPAANLTWTADKPIVDSQLETRSVVFSSDGKRFAVSINNGINTAVADVATGTRLYIVNGQCARFVGKDLYTWAAGSVSQFDAETGKAKRILPPPAKGSGMFSIGAQFSPDGKSIAGFDCGMLRIVSAESGVDAVSLGGPGKRTPDTSKTGPGEPSRSNTKTFPMTEVCWSRDGKRLAGIWVDYKAERLGTWGGLAVWDAETGKLVAHRETPFAEPSGRTVCFSFSPDGETLAVGGLTSDKRGATSLALLDATTLKTIRSTPINSRDGGADVTAVAFAPDGATVAAGVNLHSGKGPLVRALLWDVATGEVLHTFLPDHDTPIISSLAFSRDGKTLIAVTGAGSNEMQKNASAHRILIWRGEAKSR